MLATKDKKTVLHIAAINIQLEISKLLIKYGANVYSKDNQNKVPVDLLPENEDLSLICHFSLQLNQFC
ncbi:hypothetical protein CEXT_458861 [Caerostris extrusa]|uniref:Ankyrin repeat protein n=1 Tax=Caerostris extrusa TaxID=172846 RepID=A0AAV4PQZ4_CAEEX|nr:hypothetical protein CEXT_458861 [Caerostris extrusa]